MSSATAASFDLNKQFDEQIIKSLWVLERRPFFVGVSFELGYNFLAKELCIMI